MHIKRFGKKLIIFILVLVVILGVYLYHAHNNNTVTSKKNDSSKTSPSTKAINVPTPKSGVIDNNGNTTGSIPPASEWFASSNGNITLQQPVSNSTIQSGVTISGLANVDQIGYVLTDSSVGLISQGTLSVVGGKFSGNLTFVAHSNTGTLQVFYPNPVNGAEEDLIDININLST